MLDTYFQGGAKNFAGGFLVTERMFEEQSTERQFKR